MSDKWLTLVPAYNRDYKSAEAVLDDWKKGKDFRVMDMSCKWDGSYCSCRDFGPNTPDYGLRTTTFKIRYERLANIALISFVDSEWKLTGKSDGTEEEED
jgi:hypothetical protein